MSVHHTQMVHSQKKMGGLPVLIVGHDGYTRGFIYNDREIELVRNGVQIY